MEQSISSESAKRARLDHLKAQKDDENDPLLVDWDSFCVTSPVRDLADETARHTTAPVTVATLGDLHHRNSPVSGVSVTRKVYISCKNRWSETPPSNPTKTRHIRLSPLKPTSQPT
jgi:hypothetical protein